METKTNADIAEDIKSSTGVDPEKAIIITKMLEEYTLQKIERINPVEVVRNNLARIDDIIKNQMTEDRHYGIQPGTDKKTLKLPGQDLLLMNFSMRPSYNDKMNNMDNGHREYISTCFIYKFIDLENSLLVAEGSGSCSTMEAKYRLRWTPVNYTPTQEYWSLIKAKKYAEAKMCLPSDIENRKIGDKWYFCKQTENPNLADVYNTILKMARIRAKREAVQTLFAIAGAFDFKDPDELNIENAEVIPDLNKADEIKNGKPAQKEFHFDYTIPDLVDVNWFKRTLQQCKSAEEIDSFMHQFDNEMKFFSDKIQAEIREEAIKCYRVFKPKGDQK